MGAAGDSLGVIEVVNALILIRSCLQVGRHEPLKEKYKNVISNQVPFRKLLSEKYETQDL
jgi:hypothetical protein